MRNRAMWCYLEHRSRLQVTPPEEPVHRYLRGLDDQIRGHLDWGLSSTRRYDTKKHQPPALTLQEKYVSEIHDYDLTEPVDLPTIRWWWDMI